MRKSPFLGMLLSEGREKNSMMIIILSDVKFQTLKLMIHFMCKYYDVLIVSQDQKKEIFKLAKLLQIKNLINVVPIDAKQLSISQPSINWTNVDSESLPVECGFLLEQQIDPQSEMVHHVHDGEWRDSHEFQSDS